MSLDDVTHHAHPPLWRNTSFHLLWSSTFFSGFADRMAMFAILTMLGFGAVGSEAHGASLAGGFDFFFFLPYLFWSPIAGWMADRLPRQWVMFAADELRGVLILFALMLLPSGGLLLHHDQHWMAWLLTLGIGLCAATFSPIKLALVPNVVGYAALQPANAVVANVGIIGNLFGALVAGFLPNDSVRLCITVAAVAYIGAGFMWIFVRSHQHKMAVAPTMKAVFVQIAEGARYISIRKRLLMLALLAMLVWGGTSVYMPALTALSEQYSHAMIGTAAGNLAVMQACLGIGLMFGAATVGLLNNRHGNEVLIALGALGSGLAIFLHMLLPTMIEQTLAHTSFGQFILEMLYNVTGRHFHPATLGLFAGLFLSVIAGYFAGGLLVASYTLAQKITPDYLMGRVFGAKELLTELGKVCAALSVWQWPNANSAMRPLSMALGTALMATGVFGTIRYLMRGPAPTPLLNLLFRFSRLYCDGFHRLKSLHRNRVPRTGGVLLISNHTAGLDPMIIQASMQRPVRWMMAREYMLGALGWFWRRTHPIPVDRDKAQPAAARAAIDIIKRGQIVGVFPEGGINDTDQPLRPLSAGVAMIAQRSGAMIVPVHISGTPRVRSALKSYLRFSRSTVNFGKPFKLDPAMDRDACLELIRQSLLSIEKPQPKAAGVL